MRNIANSYTNVGFEETLFKAADKLRKNMDAAEYKHVVLGLIFLKFVSDAFEHRRSKLRAELLDPDSGLADNPEAVERSLEDRDEYASENIFWVPAESRWECLQANANQSDIGKQIDDALFKLEDENPVLKGVFTKNYSRTSLGADILPGLSLECRKRSLETTSGNLTVIITVLIKTRECPNERFAENQQDRNTWWCQARPISFECRPSCQP